MIKKDNKTEYIGIRVTKLEKKLIEKTAEKARFRGISAFLIWLVEKFSRENL